MRNRIWYIIGLIVLLILIFGGVLSTFYTDWLWFGEVGYRSVFWTKLLSRLKLGALAGILFFAILYLNIWLARRFAPPVLGRYDRNTTRERMSQMASRGFGVLLLVSALILSIFVALEASTHWLSYRTFMQGTQFGATDPIFNKDIGFYVFKYGFLRYIYGWLFFTLAVTVIAAAIVHYVDKAIDFLAGTPTFAPHVKAHLSLLLAAALFVKAWGYRLDAYNLLYSPAGVVFGAGYTDVHARLIALYILSVIAVIAGIIALVNIYRRGITLPVAAVAILVAASLILGVIYPAIVEQIYVKPNLISRENKYIRNNINLTRMAYNLSAITEKDFPVQNNLTSADIERNRATINSIRLWDYRPLRDTYNQLQALGPFYDIANVDIDRYTINNELRQVMLAAREISLEKAQQVTSTWINRHFQYTHGYGVVMSPVNRATEEGLPEFFIQGMPPRSSVGIGVKTPQIYFGELTYDFAVVNSSEREFDYPYVGKPNYTRYAGTGGIPISGFLQKLAFAWRFSDLKLILSNPIAPDSRLMFRREIKDRVQTIFPFLRYDFDPYLVVSNGKLYWMWDAYTISDKYPYSTPQEIREGYNITYLNYMRNAVKVVVDAYNGDVNFYIADSSDPIIKTYSRIFPGVFKPLNRMPSDLRAHIRYPELMFRLQTEALLRYHMKEPQEFQNNSDLWAIPNEIIETSNEPTQIEPYYVVMRLPGEAEEKFLLIRPFTPANRDNMVAWMAAMSDPDSYGKTVLYRFPAEPELPFGPAQIESRINQDATISAQLTLWNQSGSRVNRGNQLVIPIERSLLYIKPLYLQSETSKIPELKRVVVSYAGAVVMEPTLEAALNRIFGGGIRQAQPVTPRAAAPARVVPGAAQSPEVQALIRRAVQQFEQAQRLQRQGDWAGYGEQVRGLEQTLRQLEQQSGG